MKYAFAVLSLCSIASALSNAYLPPIDGKLSQIQGISPSQPLKYIAPALLKKPTREYLPPLPKQSSAPIFEEIITPASYKIPAVVVKGTAQPLCQCEQGSTNGIVVYSTPAPKVVQPSAAPSLYELPRIPPSFAPINEYRRPAYKAPALVQQQVSIVKPTYAPATLPFLHQGPPLEQPKSSAYVNIVHQKIASLPVYQPVAPLEYQKPALIVKPTYAPAALPILHQGPSLEQPKSSAYVNIFHQKAPAIPVYQPPAPVEYRKPALIVKPTYAPATLPILHQGPSLEQPKSSAYVNIFHQKAPAVPVYRTPAPLEYQVPTPPPHRAPAYVEQYFSLAHRPPERYAQHIAAPLIQKYPQPAVQHVSVVQHASVSKLQPIVYTTPAAILYEQPHVSIVKPALTPALGPAVGQPKSSAYVNIFHQKAPAVPVDQPPAPLEYRKPALIVKPTYAPAALPILHQGAPREQPKSSAYVNIFHQKVVPLPTYRAPNPIEYQVPTPPPHRAPAYVEQYFSLAQQPPERYAQHIALPSIQKPPVQHVSVVQHQAPDLKLQRLPEPITYTTPAPSTYRSQSTSHQHVSIVQHAPAPVYKKPIAPVVYPAPSPTVYPSFPSAQQHVSIAYGTRLSPPAPKLYLPPASPPVQQVSVVQHAPALKGPTLAPYRPPAFAQQHISLATPSPAPLFLPSPRPTTYYSPSPAIQQTSFIHHAPSSKPILYHSPTTARPPAYVQQHISIATQTPAPFLLQSPKPTIHYAPASSLAKHTSTIFEQTQTARPILYTTPAPSIQRLPYPTSGVKQHISVVYKTPVPVPGPLPELIKKPSSEPEVICITIPAKEFQPPLESGPNTIDVGSLPASGVLQDDGYHYDRPSGNKQRRY